MPRKKALQGSRRQEALEKKLPVYLSGVPCRKGHLSERLTSNGACIACAEEWRKANPNYESEYYADPETRKTRREYIAQLRKRKKRETNWPTKTKGL